MALGVCLHCAAFYISLIEIPAMRYGTFLSRRTRKCLIDAMHLLEEYLSL
jgi:hypothetical protein